MPFPEQTYAPEAQSRRAKSRSVYYPQCRATLSVVFENFGTPERPVIIPLIPRDVTIYSNSYKEADSFSLTFDAKDFPVTPGLLRSGAAEIYLFQTPGIGQLPEVVRAKDDPDTPEWEGLEPTIIGLFDSASMEYDSSGRFVTIDGTDYTSLFLAKKWREYQVKETGGGTKRVKRRIPTGKRLDLTIRDLMAEVPSSDAMQLVVEGELGDVPIVGAAESRANRKGIPVKAEDSYWDVMYGLAVRYGWILFVRGLDVVLTTPQTYIEGKTRARKLAWGRNLTQLRITRKMGQQTVPIIEVRSYDSSARKVRKGQFPQNRRQKPVTGLGTIKEEVQFYTIHGIQSEAQLRLAAETIYNLRARSEQTIEIETRDLLDLEGTDLINLRTGDAVTIGLEQRTTDLLEGMEFEQRVRRLQSLGYDVKVSREISASFERLNQFRKPFRVREATLTWTHDGGLTIQATLQNFVNIAGQTP